MEELTPAKLQGPVHVVTIFLLPFPSLLQSIFLPHTALAMSSTITQTQTQAPAITAENILSLFPEINTSLATSARQATSSELDGYDEEQVRLMDEVCIVLDEDDIPIGSASKKICVLISSNPVTEKKKGANR